MSFLRASIALLCILVLPGWCDAICAWQMTAPHSTSPNHCAAHGRSSANALVDAANLGQQCPGGATQASPVGALAKGDPVTTPTFDVALFGVPRAPIRSVTWWHDGREHAPPAAALTLRI